MRSSAILLAIASGFFLQMATNDFLPAIQKLPQNSGARKFLLPSVLAGSAVIYLANMMAGHLR